MTNRIFKVGQSREQGSFLPPRIEDYVTPDNPVRAIEAYVCALDLAGVGFRHAEGDGGAGQPPYDPGDLLKLYLYGYLNQIRSSRRLEREAGRNVELIWLLRGLVPGYRTIGNFRKDNRNALTAANRDFVMLARDLSTGRPHAWNDVAMDQDSRAAARLAQQFSRPGDSLFVWGFRPDLWVYTGLPAATRFLDSQPLTGVPADRHLTQSAPVDTEFTRMNREELARFHPTFVVDGLSLYNPALAIDRYEDLRTWFTQYREVLRTRTTVVYRLDQNR